MKRTTSALTLCLACLSFSISPAGPLACIDNLAWMAGVWRATVGQDRLEEHWAAPDGGAMMGMFRWVKEKDILVYEFMTIEAGDPMTLKLRHFGAGLKGWENKDNPLTFQLTGWSGEKAVFDTLDPQQPIRIVYRRRGEKSMEVTLEEMQNGRPAVQTFQFERD